MGEYRPMPRDFEEHAHETIAALMKRYHAGTIPVIRWKELCGTAKRYNREVIRTDEFGNEVQFIRIKEAGKAVYGCSSNIAHAIRNRRRAYGFTWRYADEE